MPGSTLNTTNKLNDQVIMTHCSESLVTASKRDLNLLAPEFYI